MAVSAAVPHDGPAVDENVLAGPCRGGVVVGGLAGGAPGAVPHRREMLRPLRLPHGLPSCREQRAGAPELRPSLREIQIHLLFGLVALGSRLVQLRPCLLDRAFGAQAGENGERQGHRRVPVPPEGRAER